MAYTTLISTEDLARHLNDGGWVIIDCRFSLADPERGRQAYLQAHIPGAVYAHLDEDLSGPVTRAVTGRHPLPTVEKAAQTFGNWGIGPDVQVVAYDDMGGALAAGRLWWMLRWLGHDAVAVLDGGWQCWVEEDRPGHVGNQTRSKREFIPHPRTEIIASTADIDAMRQDPGSRVVDARAAERYRGENETIDPVAGHIPGAVSAPYANNLTPEGKFRSGEELRAYYQSLLGSIPVERTAFYCGSGVTSIHSILAMVHAGLGEPRLYAGSWSEWITDRERPVEK